MNLASKTETVIAVFMIIFFFIPWVNTDGLLSVAGYQMPGEIVKGRGLFSSFLNVEGKTEPKTYLYYSMYLIPMLGVLVAIVNLSRKSAKPLAFILGLLPFAIFTLLFIDMGINILHIMGTGSWLTLALGLVMICVLVGSSKSRNTGRIQAKSSTPQTERTQDDSIKKRDAKRTRGY